MWFLYNVHVFNPFVLLEKKVCVFVWTRELAVNLDSRVSAVSRDAFVYIQSAKRKNRSVRCPVSRSPRCRCDFFFYPSWGQISTKTDKKASPPRMPCYTCKTPGVSEKKVHEMSFPSLWRNLESLPINSLRGRKENSRGRWATLFWPLGKNLQIKHLDGVWNFNWKICRES